ncbi:MAG: alpha-galactosidase, partial [Dehalococcoidia bacterium]
PEMTLSISVYESLPYALLEIEVKNTGQPAREVEAMKPIDNGRVELVSEPKTWRFYKNGWQSWSPTLAIACSDEDVSLSPPVHAPATRPDEKPGRFVSELMTAVVDPETGGGVTVGFVTSADQFSQIWLERDDRLLTAASYADGQRLERGRTISSETLCVHPTNDPLGSLKLFGDVLADEMHAIRYDEVASGWCSWYYYWHGVAEENIISNLGHITAKRDDLPFRYVQVDDGYQADIGDWLTVNEKFPNGLKWLVDRIHKDGFEAGLWLAPFLVGEKSQLYKDHPDWVVEYAPGRPYIAMLNWGQSCYALDLSRDDVIDWLKHVLGTVTEEWGFDYVKIDFVYAGAVDGLRTSSDFTRAQVYRRGLEAIRSAVGDRFILGCGNPLGPSVGLVDGSRIGPDVAPFWHPASFDARPERAAMSEPSALNSIRNTITRFWMHDRLWMNDPDCLMVRDSETALTEDEVRTLTTVIAMTGGMVLDSDDLDRLSPARRRMVSMLLPVYGRSAVPLDLFTSDTPRVLEMDCGSHRMVAVFNWDAESQEVSVPISGSASVVFDVWEQRYLGEHTGSLSLDVAPHGCRLLSVRPATDHPQVVGSTFHVLQGVCEIQSERLDGTELRVSLSPVAVKNGALFVRVPDGQRPVIVSGVEGGTVKGHGDGIWSIRFELREPTDLTIALADG